MNNLTSRDAYNPAGEISGGGNPDDVFASYIREVYLGPYVGTWLELLEQGYCLHLLVRYYNKPAPRYERLAIGFASAVGLYLSISHSQMLLEFVENELFRLNSLANMHWQLFSTNFVGGIVLCIVQCLYAHRMVQITRDQGRRRIFIRIGLGVAIALCLTCNTIALYTQAEMPRLTSIFDPKVATLSAYFERTKPWIILSYVGNIAVDSLICVGSVWTMVNNTARTSERPVETKNAIREYITISAKSMLFPTLCSATSIGLHTYKISGCYDAIAVYSISKLSLISILHLTLARERMRGQLNDTGVIDPQKVTMHVETQVVYERGSDYPLTKLRHPGLRCPSDTDLSSMASPGASERFKADGEMDSLHGSGAKLFWSDR
ncbi:hypothetical protein HD553DRAFT_325428 [Filobasidium floriforme]|uniref:uncharacterized protein n=1 Tax=Filobasidium floriforme TaxID=5210 RepID=UPI001E8E9750|nr:uncharacterized protein HD553DRAFT_325428 [Filobasidium floriforme]KAH8081386.1 hypothetical protein HD553DRAFT_325428 [Filobasidium floriforme]